MKINLNKKVKDLDCLWLITVYCIDETKDQDDWKYINASWDCGLYKTFEEADKAIRENATDVYECSYTYAVVKQVGFGMNWDIKFEHGNDAPNKHYYKYNHETGGWDPFHWDYRGCTAL